MSKTMKLDGGLNTYVCAHRRYLTNILPKGRKVRYLGKNGYDGDRNHANRYLTEGEILTVNEVYVGSYISDVEFEEYPNRMFNTVMFEDVEEQDAKD